MAEKKELELKPNTGLMFPNNNKTGENSQDFKGEIDIK
jgi:hypothetical protein